MDPLIEESTEHFNSPVKQVQESWKPGTHHEPGHSGLNASDPACQKRASFDSPQPLIKPNRGWSLSTHTGRPSITSDLRSNASSRSVQAARVANTMSRLRGGRSALRDALEEVSSNLTSGSGVDSPSPPPSSTLDSHQIRVPPRIIDHQSARSSTDTPPAAATSSPSALKPVNGPTNIDWSSLMAERDSLVRWAASAEALQARTEHSLELTQADLQVAHDQLAQAAQVAEESVPFEEVKSLREELIQSQDSERAVKLELVEAKAKLAAWSDEAKNRASQELNLSARMEELWSQTADDRAKDLEARLENSDETVQALKRTVSNLKIDLATAVASAEAAEDRRKASLQASNSIADLLRQDSSEARRRLSEAVAEADAAKARATIAEARLLAEQRKSKRLQNHLDESADQMAILKRKLQKYEDAELSVMSESLLTSGTGQDADTEASSQMVTLRRQLSDQRLRNELFGSSLVVDTLTNSLGAVINRQGRAYSAGVATGRKPLRRRSAAPLPRSRSSLRQSRVSRPRSVSPPSDSPPQTPRSSSRARPRPSKSRRPSVRRPSTAPSVRSSRRSSTATKSSTKSDPPTITVHDGEDKRSNSTSKDLVTEPAPAQGLEVLKEEEDSSSALTSVNHIFADVNAGRARSASSPAPRPSFLSTAHQSSESPKGLAHGGASDVSLHTNTSRRPRGSLVTQHSLGGLSQRSAGIATSVSTSSSAASLAAAVSANVVAAALAAASGSTQPPPPSPGLQPSRAIVNTRPAPATSITPPTPKAGQGMVWIPPDRNPGTEVTFSEAASEEVEKKAKSSMAKKAWRKSLKLLTGRKSEARKSSEVMISEADMKALQALSPRMAEALSPRVAQESRRPSEPSAETTTAEAAFSGLVSPGAQFRETEESLKIDAMIKASMSETEFTDVQQSVQQVASPLSSQLLTPRSAKSALSTGSGSSLQISPTASTGGEDGTSSKRSSGFFGRMMSRSKSGKTISSPRAE